VPVRLKAGMNGMMKNKPSDLQVKYNSTNKYDRFRWATFVALSSAAYATSQTNKVVSGGGAQCKRISLCRSLKALKYIMDSFFFAHNSFFQT